MAIAQQAPLRTPGTLTRLGALVIAPVGIPRRLISAAVDAFCECTAGLLSSRAADQEHDAYQLSVDRLAKLGIKNALVKGCGCERGFISIGIDNGKAMAADQREDGFIEQVLTMTRRWSKALERSLKLRKSRVGRQP